MYLFYLCFFFFTKAYPSDYFKLLNQSIKNLSVSLEEVCKSKNFFTNLISNKNYPNFGSVKDWEFFCKKVEKLNKLIKISLREI